MCFESLFDFYFRTPWPEVKRRNLRDPKMDSALRGCIVQLRKGLFLSLRMVFALKIDFQKISLNPWHNFEIMV